MSIPIFDLLRNMQVPPLPPRQAPLKTPQLWLRLQPQRLGVEPPLQLPQRALALLPRLLAPEEALPQPRLQVCVLCLPNRTNANEDVDGMYMQSQLMSSNECNN